MNKEISVKTVGYVDRVVTLKLKSIKDTKLNEWVFEDNSGNRLQRHLKPYLEIPVDAVIQGGLYYLCKQWVLVTEVRNLD